MRSNIYHAVDKESYDSQSLTIRQQAEEIRLLRKNLDTVIMNYASILPHHLDQFTVESCKKEIDTYNAEIEAAKGKIK